MQYSLPIKMQITRLQKLFSLITSINLIVQALAPATTLLTPSKVFAQEQTVTPSPSPTLTPTPEAATTPAPSETVSPTPTAEITPTVTPETSPTTIPTETTTLTPTPTEVSPTPTPTEPPHETSPPTPTPTNAPTPTPTIEIVPTPQGHLATTILSDVKASSLNLDAATTQSSATLITDKADYAPTDTAVITGTGFLANHTYSLTISSNDPPATSTTVNVTTNAEGTFIYAYQLDGNYRPNYKVEIKDGKYVVATTTFTDSISADIDQCRNGAPGSPVVCTGGAWGNGNAGKTNSHYREGDSIPYRIKFGEASTSGTNSVTIQWDTTKGGKHAIDYLTTYNTTETTADPCSGIAGCGSPTTFGIPDDPNSTVTQIPGVFTLYNGTITSVSFYTLSGSYAGDSSTSIKINFNATNTTPVLAWGGHIGSQIDWGNGNSAVNISGSPYHMRVGGQDRSLSADAILPTPGLATQISASTITLGQSVTDTATYTEVGSGNNSNGPVTGTTQFYVCGPGTVTPCTSTSNPVGSPVTNSADSATSPSFTPGSTGTYCFAAYYTPNSTAQYSPTNSTVTTNECVTVSIPPKGTLVVHKIFTDQYSNSGITINLSGTGTGTQVTNGSGDATFSNLNPGSYTAYATEPAGYYESANTCLGVSATAGQTTNCTITDSPIVGTITVHKTVVGTSTALTNFCFTLSPDPSKGQVCANENGDAVFTNVPPDTYTATEIASAANYTQTNTTCDVGMTITNNGDSKSCTVTNTRDQGVVSFLKVVNGGTSVASDWTFNIADNGTAKSGDSKTYNTGSYTVTESGPANYTLIDASGACALNNDVVTLTVTNQDGTCTITNTQDTGDLKVVKILNDQTSLTAWSFSLDGGQPVSANAQGQVDFGQVTTGVTHTIAESGPSGYHLASITGTDCTNNNGVANATVSKAGTTTCTFTNDRDTGAITVHKLVDTDGDGTFETANPETFVWGVDGVTPDKSMGSSTVVTTGIHTINENVVTNYHFVGWYRANGEGSCTNPDSTSLPASIDVFTDTTTTITLCNARDMGKIKVVKSLDPQNDSGRFNLLIDQTTVATNAGDGGNGELSVPTGAHSVSETGNDTNLSNYNSSISCNNEQSGEGTSLEKITVAKDQTVTCTITNTIKRGTIIVTKYLDDNANGKHDEGEPALPDWTINLGEQSNITDASGKVTFGNLLPDTYELSENLKDGWIQKSLSCDLGEGGSVSVAPGQTVHCEIGNYQKAHITVLKHIVNPKGDDVNDGTTKFTFNVTSQEAVALGDDESVKFNVDPGTYDVTETLNANYTFDSCTAEYDGESVGESIQNGKIVSVQSGDSVTVTCTNRQKTGTITGYKWNDVNGNHKFDCTQEGEFPTCEDKLSAWIIFIDANGNGTLDEGETTTTTNEDGNYTLTVNPGTYTVCEVGQGGWTQTYPQDGENHNCHTVTVGSNDRESGSGKNFGNEFVQPTLEISKINNASSDKAPGDSVLYTITVKALDNTAYNVKVTDLLPDGFKYRHGSWTATLNGSPLALSEPTYASPGIWTIGDMAKDDVVVLTLIADINGGVKPGLYKDLAWAYGCNTDTNCSVGDTGSVLSQAVNPGKLNDTFVSTSVNLNKDAQNSSSINIEHIVQGSVLGASTELPATGASNVWVMLAGTLTAAGLALTTMGLILRRKYA